MYKGTAARERVAAFSTEAAWRCAALEATQAWLQGYVSHLPQRRRSALSVALCDALRPLAQFFVASDSARADRDPLAAGVDGTAGAAIMAFQHRLLEAYLAMPYAEAFEDIWEPLLNCLCVEPLRDGSSYLSAHTGCAVHQVLLRPLLNQQDEALALYLEADEDGFAQVLFDLLLPCHT